MALIAKFDEFFEKNIKAQTASKTSDPSHMKQGSRGFNSLINGMEKPLDLWSFSEVSYKHCLVWNSNQPLEVKPEHFFTICYSEKELESHALELLMKSTDREMHKRMRPLIKKNPKLSRNNIKEFMLHSFQQRESRLNLTIEKHLKNGTEQRRIKHIVK